MAESLKVAQLYAEFSTKGLKETQTSLNGVQNTLGQIKGLLATVVSGFAIKKMASDFVKAAQTAENYRTSIRAVSDSIKEADSAFDRIRSWAESNPVNTDEAIGAFVRLKTAAVNNSEEALKSVADLSSVMQMDMRDVSDAIVSAQAISLRRMGILLNQAGKKAIIESNGIRKEVNKDIASIRQGIIDVMKEAYGGSMAKARDNFDGILKTMGGMWTGFKQRIMEGANGPFETLKVKLAEIRDSWDAWMKTDDFDRLVENVQSNLVSAINAADTAMRTLGAGIKVAYEHADLLKAAFAAIVTYKAGMLALSVATSSLVANTAAWLSLAPLAIKSAAAFQSWISLIGASLGPVGILAAAVGVGVWLDIKNQMKQAEDQSKRTREEIEKVNNEFATASAQQITDEIARVTQELEDLETQAKKTYDEMMKLSTEKFVNGGGISASIKGFVDPQLAATNNEIERLQTRLKELGKMEKNATASGNKKTPLNPITADTGKKGKSAAEKLVENIRDQMKYLSADGNSFVGVLDKWLAKLKPLTSDWKVIKDLINDIYGQTIQDDSSKADRVLERIENEKQALKDQAEMMKNANSEYLADITQRNNMALITDRQYFDSAMGEWKKYLANLAKQGLELKNLVTIPPEAIEAFNTAKEATLRLANSGMAKLREEFDKGRLSFDVYMEKLRLLLESYKAAPEIINAILAQVEADIDKNKQGIIDLRELTTQWIKDFQSGIADAIVDGEGFADTLTNIGKEIEKMILKLLLFGKDGSSGWLGGLSSWVMSIFGHHSGGIIGSDSPTFTRQIQLPKFHSGGIVGAGEELAVLKKGEGVFTEAQMDALGDMGGIGKIEVNVDVTNSGSGGNMTEKQADQLGRTIREVVKAEVTNSLYDYARSGMLRTA